MIGRVCLIYPADLVPLALLINHEPFPILLTNLNPLCSSTPTPISTTRATTMTARR
ncbi:MAG: hypothetical protein LZF86_190320 [Nitrospira sp.]|nr:MAG: hypothetical protein LZF86_190320 [Nitrospira sp.]